MTPLPDKSEDAYEVRGLNEFIREYFHMGSDNGFKQLCTGALPSPVARAEIL